MRSPNTPNKTLVGMSFQTNTEMSCSGPLDMILSASRRQRLGQTNLLVSLRLHVACLQSASFMLRSRLVDLVADDTSELNRKIRILTTKSPAAIQ